MKVLRLWLILFALAMLVTSCEHREPEIIQSVLQTDRELRNVNGVIEYHHKPLTGFVYDVSAKGDTLLSARYSVGQEDGWARKWYPNHQLAEERFYAHGKRENTHRAWWPNGKLRFQYNYANDLMQGSEEEWFESGAPYRKLVYKAGYEDGKQTVWNFDGALFANYVAKDGRNYGLTGVMNCINYLKSDSNQNESLMKGAVNEK